ncbi:MAG: hypothetical protein II894_09730 [Bacteroidales bacterium]|nr:hypothetical protein [Bacteroidales bacterium]
MYQKENFYFRPENLQRLVKQEMDKYKNVGAFARKIGIDGSNFVRETGLNPERWKNPTASSLAKFAVFLNVPIEYFFIDIFNDEGKLIKQDEDKCEECERKDALIESLKETIDAQKIAISALQTSTEVLKKAYATDSRSAVASQTA